MGRPKKGALSSFPNGLLEDIKKIRAKHEGWGIPSIVDELIDRYGYSKESLPSQSSIHRYLKEQGLILTSYSKVGHVPSTKVKVAKAPHDLWEVDAQGAILVGGIGYHVLINMKDSCSLKYCMTFPVSVRHVRHKPSTRHYLWAFRLAFEESGLPKAIQVDKDSTFYENQSNSPYPSRVQLWLTGLGIRMHFIDLPPPLKQAKVERSHQTMEKQVLKGQTYDSWKSLWLQCKRRRQRLNEHIGSRSLNGKTPLQAFPKAKHSGRFYTVEEEAIIFDRSRIDRLLSQYLWYRKVSNAKTVSLGRKIYYLKKAKSGERLSVRYSKRKRHFIFRNAKGQLIAKMPPKGLELEQLIREPIEQLKTTKYWINKLKKFTLDT